MISLPALEEPFARLYPRPRTDRVWPSRASSTRAAGASSVHDRADQPARGQRPAAAGGPPRRDAPGRGTSADKIPTLGTGKTDYKVLRAQLLEAVQAQTSAR